MVSPTTAMAMTPNLFSPSLTWTLRWRRGSLTDVSQWMSTHHLKINPNKTELLLFRGNDSKTLPLLGFLQPNPGTEPSTSMGYRRNVNKHLHAISSLGGGDLNPRSLTVIAGSLRQSQRETKAWTTPDRTIRPSWNQRTSTLFTKR
ncbi:uncharacterized protein AB9W97_000816 isoform 2-T6 [Spinachia spinachia]